MIATLAADYDFEKRPTMRTVSGKDAEVEQCLWHYTRWDTAALILEHRNIRASHVAFLNDTHEIVHGLQWIKRLIGLDALQSFYAEDEKLFELEQLRDIPVYVACLSKKPDDLSQWRGYGHPPNGVALGLADRLLNYPGTNFLRLDCAYTPAEAQRVLAPLKEQILAGLPQPPRDRGPVVSFEDQFDDYLASKERANVRHFLRGPYRTMMVQAAAQLKHWAFQDEAEVRLARMALTDSDDVREDGRYPTATREVPFVNCSLKPEFYRDENPIKYLLVGPCDDPAAAETCARQLLDRFDYRDVEVISSRVPFQNWL